MIGILWFNHFLESVIAGFGEISFEGYPLAGNHAVMLLFRAAQLAGSESMGPALCELCFALVATKIQIEHVVGDGLWRQIAPLARGDRRRSKRELLGRRLFLWERGGFEPLRRSRGLLWNLHDEWQHQRWWRDRRRWRRRWQPQSRDEPRRIADPTRFERAGISSHSQRESRACCRDDDERRDTSSFGELVHVFLLARSPE
ncbi:MAG TPA: hypothetical protein VEQ58_13190 [Polyangiaceae bacterium]|nr:hypothetical protein [Polyangiaceae bacterium]